MSLAVTRWMVTYGTGEPREVRIPHAWRQEVDVRWEGPATYRTLIDVPIRPSWLRFHGVSYHAEILIDDQLVAEHRGIWDAFDVDLTPYKGKRVEVTVLVTKNGGAKIPVAQTLAGFLPYVFHTFGGIFRPVEIVDAGTPLALPVPDSRYAVEGNRITCQGEPLYLRGVLHWGWYPEFGHAEPSEEVIAHEITEIRKLGFNCVKFCLWLPPHRYLRMLEAAGLHAWIELPLWLPGADLFQSAQVDAELERIVRQYAHHPNIAAWTVGCELFNAPVEWLQRTVRKVHALTKSPLIKDNSGGAEMYDADPVEFGSFEDFHPYGDVHFFPPLLDSLTTGPRTSRPILLGETCDHDVHRDLNQIAESMPFWASGMKELNDKGVRWQYDLPGVVRENRFAHRPEESGHPALMQRSIEKARFVRKTIVEAIRSRGDLSGYVLTGLRDTPISSSGILTDWNRSRYRSEEFLDWNGEAILFLIPARSPKWTRGGNRAGYVDVFNFFEKKHHQLKIGFTAPAPQSAALIWKLIDQLGNVVREGAEPMVQTKALDPREVGQVVLRDLPPGPYTFHAQFGSWANSWTLHVHPVPDLRGIRLEWADDRFGGVEFGSSGCTLAVGWRESLRPRIALGEPMIVLIEGEGGIGRPFWRESITTEPELWEQMLSIAPDQAIDPKLLDSLGRAIWLQTRVDTRTYEELPYIARIGNTVLTTYRPQGGLGIQPHLLSFNPAGQSFLVRIAKSLNSPVGAQSEFRSMLA